MISPIELLINKIAQDRISFNQGLKLLLESDDFNFEDVFALLKNYIFNSIPNKVDYNTETYQRAINTIPLKQTYTSIMILKTYDTKIAFNKLRELPEAENKKTVTSLIWVFKITDTECKNGCGHFWHKLE
ncbi:hypothetical protein B0A81_18035 [Flavobacterium plurextorum]|uniref:Uncharacterized protein n=1 Tax=Flavobacterium plurextorum TaxID=1114867 RepID=A0ABX4CRR4_9FLAO|nr:DUF5958 family protein [Flavobacterium plurextorum]OXB03890.1 hypothetical protein B0A81_18035 [Flavobacterium plurextorum]